MGLKDWIGAAGAVAQVTRITFSAYTSGQTYTLTINNKSISYTAAASTSADVFAGLVAAWEAALAVELQEATATVSSGVLLTADVAGKPFTVTATATAGITSTITAVTAATGPNYFSNAANWSGNSLPSAGDDLRFRNSTVSLLYDLESATDYASVTIESTFTGDIGLPASNSSNYPEYRPRFLKLGTSTSYSIRIGQGTGSRSSRILIDANGNNVTVQVYGTGQATGTESPVVLKNTGSSSTVEFYSGFMTIDSDSSHSLASCNLIASQSSGSQGRLVIAEGVAAGVVKALGGELEISGSATSLIASGGARCTITGEGTCPVIRADSGAIVYYDSTEDVATSVEAANQGTLDFSRNGSPKAVAAATIHGGGKILDPLSIVTWTAGIFLSGCTLAEVTLDVGRGATIST